MKLITASMLKGACREQRELFKSTFPDGAPVTVAATRKARKAGLDVSWLVRLLPSPLYKQYWDAIAPLDKQYQDARDKLLVSYLRRVEGGK